VAEQGRSDRSRRRASGRAGVPQPKAKGDRQHQGRSERPESTLQRRGDRQRREVSEGTPPPTEGARPGLARRRNEPPIPEGVDSRSLHVAVRAELRSLPKDLAEIVAAHLVVAGQLVDDDPELAYAHAEAARRRAARLPIVREAAAETAYAAGLYDVALTEFRALRRMTGTPDYLPVMADCERALGRPHNALKLAREADRAGLDPALRIEMIIVEAGARRDLGQDHESRRILERAIAQARPEDVAPRAVARLRYAYADALLADGQEPEARQWFASAAKLDHDQETDAQQRIDELDGFLIDYDEGDEGDQQSSHGPERDVLS
jgi:tetratricopeptide (TPR) repeat protein